ncbi:MAG: NAD-dependent epimerase/dehydratase family protein, partial [Acidimicrobiales bacterium]
MAVDDRPSAAVPVLRDQRILVLGPMSSVGGPVVRALAADNQVWGASRFRRDRGIADLEAQGVHPVRVDLADPDLDALPAEIDFVVNFAVSHAPDFATALASNAENLGLVMERARGAKAFLHCSSTGVYQPNGEHPMAETDPLGDNHRVLLPTYSISKIAAEVVARLACRQHQLPTVIARLNVPYGPGVGLPAMHLECILTDTPVGVRPERTVYNPIHIDDIVRQVPALLAAADVPAPTVNWAGPDTVSVEEWCAYLGGLVGREGILAEDPTALGSVAVDTTLMDELIGAARVRWQDGMH